MNLHEVLGNMKFRVKAKEIWYWDIEIEAESREALEAKINEEFVETFNTESGSDLQREWEVMAIN